MFKINTIAKQQVKRLLIKIILTGLVFLSFLVPAYPYDTLLTINVDTCGNTGVSYGEPLKEGGKEHTGIDCSTQEGKLHNKWTTYVESLSWGKVAFRWQMSTNNPCNTLSGCGRADHGMGNVIEIEYLLNDGSTITSSYNHLKNFVKDTNEDSYIVDGQKVGIIGASGQENNEYYTKVWSGNNNPHLHLEMKVSPRAGGVISPWGYSLPTGEEGNPVVKIEKDPDDYGFRNPSDYLERKNTLMASLSRVSDTPSFNDYHVYGISKHKIYGYLNVDGVGLEKSGIIVRESSNRLEADNNDFSAEHEWLVESTTDFQNLYDTFNDYKKGDYLFVPYAKKAETKAVYGYPIVFSFLNDGDVIVDNNQINKGNYEYIQNIPKGSAEHLIPGYYLTSQLTKGRSGASAQWKPNVKGKYKIFVHIPLRKATATNLIYSIKGDGFDKNSILSIPINQRDSTDSWVMIKAEDGASEFDFNNQGYVEVFLGKDDKNQSDNAQVDEDTWVAFDAIKFERISSEITIQGSTKDLALALVIDSSGSMVWENKIECAKLGVEGAIKALSEGDFASVSHFSTTPNTPPDLMMKIATDLLGATNTDDKNSALSKILPGGGTCIGKGLQEGITQLTSASDSMHKAAILLSDGQDTCDGYDKQVQDFVDYGWPITTIKYGSDAKEKKLRNIAIKTGGSYEEGNCRNIPATFFRIVGRIVLNSLLLATSEVMEPDGSVLYNIFVEVGSKILGVFADWQGSKLKITLYSPSGKILSGDNFTDLGGRFIEGKRYQFVELINPEAGEWQVELTWDDPPPIAEQVNTTVVSKTDIFSSILGFKPEYKIGDKVLINVAASEIGNGYKKFPLRNAKVTASILVPGPELIRTIQAQSSNLRYYTDVIQDNTRNVELFDDGAHGDYKSGDGVWGGFFSETQKKGPYIVTAHIDGQKRDGTGVNRQSVSSFLVGSLFDADVTASQVLQYDKKIMDKLKSKISNPLGTMQGSSSSTTQITPVKKSNKKKRSRSLMDKLSN